MEPPKSDVPKLPDMVMCGDHPSFTKTELNVKELKPDEEKEKEKKTPASYARISPSSSRTDRDGTAVCGGSSSLEVRTRAASEHALRLMEARRRARPTDQGPRELDTAPPNRALVQAALGSFRWPPYLLAVWVAVLVLTHVLHCLVTLLERALPNVKKFCQYFRGWTEEAWKVEGEAHRVLPLGLAVITGVLYSLYFALYTLYAVALWAIEPLCSDLDEKHSSVEVMDAKVTNYVDEVVSKTNTSYKH